MAITLKRDGHAIVPVGKQPMAPIVRHYALSVNTTAEAADIELGLDGFVIPVGGASWNGNIGAGTVKFTYNGTDLATTAAPSATPAINTAAAVCAPGTAAATAKLSLTTAGTVTAGTVYLTVLLIPICNAAKGRSASVGN